MHQVNCHSPLVTSRVRSATASGRVLVGYRWSPFACSKLELKTYEAGKTLRELAPVTDLAFVCLLDNEPVLREDWDYVPTSDDQVVFQCLVAGGDDSNPLRTILTIALLVVANSFVPGSGLVGLLGEGGAIIATPFIQAGIVFVGTSIINALLPPPGPKGLNLDGQTQSQSSVFSVSVTGNQAKLGDVIPVMYGRHLIYPDFASQPYSEYDNSGEDADGKPANDQFYYALFCIGMGNYSLEKVLLDDTDIAHFEDVEYAMLPPGTPPTMVEPAVVNSVEVSGQTMLTGEYIGPFTIVGPGNEVDQIGIDIVFPRGLYRALDNGNLSTKTAQWLVEARTVDDEGVPSGPWNLLGSEEYEDDRSVQIRKTYLYSVTPGRYEVRVQRQDTRDDNIRAGHDIAWGAMRGYLNVGTTLNPDATYFELRMRANEQLNGLSQRRIAVIVQRLIPTWSTAGGWGPEIATSSIAWAAADILRNGVYGGGYPDSRIDLATLESLDEVWSERGDTFNFVFDQRSTIWDALNTVCRAGRTARLMRGGVFTFSRDQSQVLPVTMFNPRNISRGSLSIDYITPTEETPDGLEVNYFDEDTWSFKSFILPAPGVTEPEQPSAFSLPGVTKLSQIQRESIYTLAANTYRRKFVRFSTEMDGFIVSFGDLIGISHDITSWGKSRGEVLAYDSGTFAVTLSESVLFDSGNNYIAFNNSQGDLVGPFLCEPGADQYEVILEGDPGMDFQTDLTMERTRFSFGTSTEYVMLARVLSVKPSSSTTVEVFCVIEDERVHTADEVVPPDPGDNPIGRFGGYAPNSMAGVTYAAATTEQRELYGFYADESGYVDGIDPGYAYQPD